MPRNATVGGDGFRIAYLAGFFDGEGSIYPRNGLQVSAVQIDATPLVMLQMEFGGRVRAPGATQKSPTSAWVIYGKPAADALRAMLPFLVVKHTQARYALEYDALVGRRSDAHHGRQVSDEVKTERERLRGLILSRRTGHVARREDVGEFGRA